MGDGVRILITGGTFDKVYHPILEQLVFDETRVPEILKLGRVKAKTAIEQLMLKDSLYMTDDDRQLILERCQGSLENRIVITHGTGTIVETAKVLGQNLEGKTAVLTGAMVPYSVSNSDAVFNFGGAFYAAFALPSGVYIAMNGKIFNWDNVRKNPATREFEQLTNL